VDKVEQLEHFSQRT